MRLESTRTMRQGRLTRALRVRLVVDGELNTTPPTPFQCARGRHPRLGLAVRCGDLALYRKKTCLFGRFFSYVQPKKNQNDATIFVNIEGFRPCLSKLSYRAPKWALMIRLVQKERLKSPQKSLIIENQAFGVIFGILAKTALLVILASHFRARVDTPTKSPTWGLA